MFVVVGALGGISGSASARTSWVAAASKCPLTGRSAPAGTNVSRPAVAVKIDNAPGADAPALQKADLVFESLVEGGITRFTAVFHCKDAGAVGAVRSARADDPGFVSPVTNALAYSGANAFVAEELDRRQMVSVTEADDPDAFTRSGSALLVDTSRARATARAAGVGRPSSLRFGGDHGRTRARAVTLDFGGTDIEYRWKDSAWRRSQNGHPFMLADGRQAAAKNVLVWEVDVGLSREIFDSAGAASPELALKGSGRAFLFRDAHVVKGTWTNFGDDTLPVFKTKRGDRFELARGVTWIELVPSGLGEVTGRVSFR
ncbi:MAG TPA: DUF3048 domain-containing protein [Actinomycetota bacterium]|nr:DUF3048 domain-containing protein [Actinomycetota bacterium]